MKIAVDARSLLSPSPRGEGKSLVRLYQEIARQRPDWAMTLYGESGGAKVPDLPHSTVRTFDLPGFRFNTWENVGLPLLAWRQGADLLHSSSSSAPRFVPIPVVMTVHDLIPLVFNDGWSDIEVARFRRQIEVGLRTARAVIAVSRHTRDDLVQVFRIDPKRVTVVHWGTDARPLAPCSREELVVELGVAGLAQPYLLAFGGDARRKNTATVLRAFAAAARRTPVARLVIVSLGNDRTRDGFLTLARDLGIADRVDLLGYVSDENLDRLYANCLGLLYVSLYEGFGLPVLEAMARGVPVIASNTTSIPEVAGDAALLVAPTSVEEIASAVVRVVTDADLAMHLRERGIARARAFSWQHTAAATVSTFEAAREGPKSNAASAPHA
jgi:glycosyltransferase involved in cell wall biosynthesis